MVGRKLVNKRMVVVINKMCVEHSGGFAGQGNNLRDGQHLSFVDNIHINELFGQQIYSTIYDQAAAYMFYIIKNHTFQDGNKRTGLACAITFLEYNGIYFAPLPEEPVFEFVMNVAAGDNNPDVVVPKIADWLRYLSKLAPG